MYANPPQPVAVGTELVRGGRFPPRFLLAPDQGVQLVPTRCLAPWNTINQCLMSPPPRPAPAAWRIHSLGNGPVRHRPDAIVEVTGISAVATSLFACGLAHDPVGVVRAQFWRLSWR